MNIKRGLDLSPALPGSLSHFVAVHRTQLAILNQIDQVRGRFLGAKRNVLGTASATPFPPPWSLVEHDESFTIDDAKGQKLAYVYFEDNESRR